MTQDEAFTILKTGTNVFLTGEPGAGKTYTINRYVEYLRAHEIEPAITASTGIAATHIAGMTIHSWSGIGIKSYLSAQDVDHIASNENIVRRVGRTKVLIIDEVSMLSGKTLDMVDLVCREVKRNPEPFGGIQVILVGDFFQLPPIEKREDQPERGGMFEDAPVVTRFAYTSDAWKRMNPLVCYLTEQHRQDDSNFLSLLSAIRADNVGEDHFEYIQERIVDTSHLTESVTRLFPHNADVDRINNEALGKIEEESHVFEMQSEGYPAIVAVLKKGCLSPEKLILKIGATVMFTKNNPKEGYVNGTLGVVEDFDGFQNYPVVRTREDKLIVVEPMEWTVEENGKIRARIMQLPLRLAWAITVHKSQGMSLDAAVMDLSHVFEYGQGYVALSRVRRLSGLYLLGINAQALKVHPEVLEKDAAFREASDEAVEVFAKMSPESLHKMHGNFIRAAGGTLIAKAPEEIGEKRAARRARRPPVSPLAETLALLSEHKTISEIAKTRGLSEGTIIAHIEKLRGENQITYEEALRHIPVHIQKNLDKIHAAFQILDTDKLAPVFEELKGAYSYDDLRLAKIALTPKTKKDK